ncbi:ABC transporter ATP-binding protein, partial [Salmonella enterica subsp. enterica]|nr:ABC transporter ATP-binding protein [Salmonella enterica subsp. enterica]
MALSKTFMQTAPLLMVLVMIAGCGSRDVDGNSLKEEV